MPSLWDKIHTALEDDRFIVGIHARERLADRRIQLWQVIDGSLEGKLLAERPNARPNPVVELDILLPDGTTAKVVWSWLESDQVAKLVTVHYYDR